MGYDASLDVEAIRQPDAAWAAKRDAWNACEAAGVEPPKELQEFFGYKDPDPHGVTIPLVSVDVARMAGRQRSKDDSAVIETIDEEGTFGYLLDPTKLPEGTLLRVVVRSSW